MLFGDIVFYCSPSTLTEKPCVYLRQEGFKHVVMFENADWAARVTSECLKTAAETGNENIMSERHISSDLTYCVRFESARYNHDNVPPERWPEYFDEIFDMLRKYENQSLRMRD